MKIIKSIISIFSLLLIIGCASQASPGGGPKDKTPPEILWTIPENGAINVQSDMVFEVEFSERIIVEKNDIFISPPEPEFEFKPVGKGFILKPKGDLLDDITYIITISTDLTDLRNNKLESGQQIAFSTGESLDSISISGRLLDDDISPAKYKPCVLWRMPFDSIRPPDYIAWTDSSGNFEFNFLPEQQYILAGFSKLDGENMPEIIGDYCINHSKIKPSLDDEQQHLMIMASHDTIGLFVKMISQKDDYSFEVKMSEKVGVTGALRIQSEPELGEFKIFPGYGRYEEFRFFFDEPIKAGEYSLKLQNILTAQGVKLDIDSLDLKIDDKRDTIPPFIVSRTPEKIIREDEENVYIAKFKHPIKRGAIEAEAFKFDTLESENDSITIIDTTFVSIPGKSKIFDPYTLKFIPDLSLIDFDIEKARWKVADAMGYNGKIYSDTLWENFLYGEKKKSGSLLVKLSDPYCDDLIVMLNSKNRIEKPLQPTDSGYVATGLAEGAYKLWAYCDSNGDSTYSAGDIIDIKHAEKSFFYGDSVKVRERWITEIHW